MPRTLPSLFTATALAVASAFVAAPSAELRTERLIAAPVATVWDSLASADGQLGWNLGLRAMSGQLEEGHDFDMTIDLGGGRSMLLHPTVTRRDERAALCWRARMLVARLLDGEHCYLLTAEGAGTRLENRERFTGVLLWVIDVETYRPAFDAANAALAASLTSDTPA